MGMSTGDKARLDELVRARMLRLNAVIQGLVSGFLVALAAGLDAARGAIIVSLDKV